MLESEPPASTTIPGGWKRNVAVFLTSQALSLFGSALVQYALMWHITLTTKSGAMMALMIILGFLPTFLLSPFAGVFADRHDRKRIIMMADAGIALATLFLALVYARGGEAIGLLLLVSAIRSVGQAFHMPAVGAFLPQMVPPESLMRVNAVNGSVQSALSFAAPVAAGALLSLAPFQVILFVDVSTASLAVGLLALFLRVPPHAKASHPQSTGYFEDLKLGFRYVRDHRYLVGFFVYMALLFFLIAPAAFLTPLQTARTYGPEVWRLTALEIAFSAGMTAGGALLAAIRGFRNRMITVVASTLAMALCTAALGLAPSFWVYIGFMVLFGFAIPYFNTPLATLLQEHVEPDYLGRVFSINSMISSSMMPVGMLAFGPLGDLVRIEILLIGTGVAIAALGIGVLMSRTLMEMGEPVPSLKASMEAAPDPAGASAPGASADVTAPEGKGGSPGIDPGTAAVDAFIAGYPPKTRGLLEELRALIRENAPGAAEKISYGIPTFTLNGNLVHFSGYERHIGFYPGSEGISAFEAELAGYKRAKGSVRFPVDRPLPRDLIARIVRFRVGQNRAKQKR